MNKRILMLLQSPFPPDTRVEREISALSQNGYDVAILCNQYERGKDPEFPFCKIIRIHAYFSSVKLNKIFNFPLFLNPRFIWRTISSYLKIRPDFVHAHDLPMVPLAVLLKFLFRVKIIFDSHESYPEALVYFEKKGIIDFIFKNPKAAKILEKYCVKISDRLVVVVQENKERWISRGVPAEKIFVVSNTVDLQSFNMKETEYKVPDYFTDHFIILYSGKVSPTRALHIPILAITKIASSIQNVMLVILGDGPNIPDLKRLAREEQVESYVQFVKWPGHKNIVNFFNRANICIIPQPSNEHINSGVPNKLFEYMALQRTILVSDAKPMSRIVREVKCGQVFKSNDVNDFAAKVIELSNTDENYGLNGKNAVLKKYNWEYDSIKLLELYESFNKIL